jgi:tryptophan synthase alpha chain
MKILGGFGVSTREQVLALTPLVHAVVVGSAFVREIARGGDPNRVVREKLDELLGRV